MTEQHRVGGKVSFVLGDRNNALKDVTFTATILNYGVNSLHDLVVRVRSWPKGDWREDTRKPSTWQVCEETDEGYGRRWGEPLPTREPAVMPSLHVSGSDDPFGKIKLTFVVRADGLPEQVCSVEFYEQDLLEAEPKLLQFTPRMPG